MFQLFQHRLSLTRGVVLPSQVDYIRRIYKERISFLRTYYRERSFYLKNNHILVRLLSFGMGSLKTPYETFVDTITDRTDSLIRHFQFTGSANYGKIWYGDFYGDGSYEIIIGSDESFNIDNAYKNWKELTPVTVLDHPVSDFSLSLPNGRTVRYLDGLSVILINIPMLMFQYRCYIEDIRRKQVNGQISPPNPAIFLYQYVLPGMMLSHIDHVLINRLINNLQGRPMTESIVRDRFFQASAGNNSNSGIIKVIDKAQDTVIEKIKNKNMPFDQVLENVFTIYKENALQTLIMPDLALTRQVWWAFILSRLKHMQFLLQVNDKHGVQANRIYTNRLSIDLQRLLDSRVLDRMLVSEYKYDTIELIEDLINMSKS